jgi:hypothetical protein
MRNLLVFLFLVLASGCGGGGSDGVKFGAPPPGTGSSSGSSPTFNAIVVRGIRIVPPDWFPSGDDPALAAAIDEYVLDASSALRGWLPVPAQGSTMELVIILHDTSQQNWWQSQTRTAWLEWPRGTGGKPRKSMFAPFIGAILALDHARERGYPGGPLTQDEQDAWTRGIPLPVVLRTIYPNLYE